MKHKKHIDKGALWVEDVTGRPIDFVCFCIFLLFFFFFFWYFYNFF